MRLGLAGLLYGALLVSPIHAQSSASPAGALTVEVVGLDSDDGTVRVALDDASSYEEDENVRAASISVQDGTAQWIVADVSPGTYAVRLYHDENGNEELDTNLLGIPQEAFGFSNDAGGRFGPPDFEDAAFTLPADSLSITITAK
jgi:uncharacterized protein (DUF2141 family)